jgi:GT2 family glycosyltransferase
VSPRVVEADDPRLSVTIASYNRRERLGDVLRALGRQSYPAERFEVVLVLDGSTDGSAEMARALELPYSLRVLEQENRGLAASRNRGGREAENPVVVWLDDDVVPLPGFLSEHAGAHRRAREDHIALGSYPPAPQHGETNLFSLQARQFWTDHFRRLEEPGHHWTFVDFADGNLSFSRSLLLETGGWDESFPGGRRQDWEFAIRLMEQGLKLAYYPDAKGLHHFTYDFRAALRKKRVEGHNDVLIALRHPQMGGHLPLVDAVRAVGDDLGFRRGLVYQHPRLGAALLRPGLPLVHLYQHWKLRHRWRRLVGLMVSNAYVRGVRDVLPDDDEFRAFAEPILRREHVTVVPVALDGEGSLGLASDVGPVELELMLGDRMIGRFDAMESEDQWDWNRLTERALETAWYAGADADFSPEFRTAMGL